MNRITRLIPAALLAGAALAAIAPAPAQAGPVPWQHVLAYCHHSHACHPVPAAIRADLGIGHRPARMRFGDTTYIWVRGAHGTVTTFTS